MTLDMLKVMRLARARCPRHSQRGRRRYNSSTLLLRAGQTFHFVLIDLDFSGLLHLIAQVCDEQSEKLLLFALQKRIANLVLLHCKVLLRRFLLVQERKHDASVSIIDGTTDFTGLHREGHRSTT